MSEVGLSFCIFCETKMEMKLSSKLTWPFVGFLCSLFFDRQLFPINSYSYIIHVYCYFESFIHIVFPLMRMEE
ncbi:uncharacterized protein Gasu_23370 [Galdieria sulphuraria]|uniref:Uncharacterized protein n=1 Tax=Galdieria sulphuraria TaxID=130081 RepID=M2X245_GALSU|nr:uncharacterized protein Gasu_23370 [Galdieria sulphuraria]EME30435.1 hypothetical protein Gasu_23370 [Galdieria sulphuraria]|eukprot:XP_005706955.1 hypothetical protein Gasu_23370 [Galdieria sulphuraria]